MCPDTQQIFGVTGEPGDKRCDRRIKQSVHETKKNGNKKGTPRRCAFKDIATVTQFMSLPSSSFLIAASVCVLLGPFGANGSAWRAYFNALG